MRVMPGRYTAQIDAPFVVFLIGMRINRWSKVRDWWTTMVAMPPMLQALYSNPAKGFLAGEYFLYWPGLMVLQYWRSFEDLEHLARDPADSHLGSWRRYNRAVGSGGSAGMWDETYQVAAGQYEAVYANMPVFGLAAATAHVPAVGRRETARGRLGGEAQPAVPSPS